MRILSGFPLLFDYIRDVFLKLTIRFAKNVFAQKALLCFEGVWVTILRAFSMLFDNTFDAILGRPLQLRKEFLIAETFCTKSMLH